MEDILSSIRKIISQDDKPEPAPVKAETAATGIAGEERRWHDGKQAASSLDVPARGSRAAPGAGPQAAPAGEAGNAARAAASTNFPPSPPPSTLQPASANMQTAGASGSGAFNSLANLAARIKQANAPAPTAPEASPARREPAPASARPAPGPSNGTPQYPGRAHGHAAAQPSPAALTPQSKPAPAMSAPAPAVQPQPAAPSQAARPAQAPAPEPRKPETAPRDETREFRAALVSPSTESAVHGSIDRLKKSMLDDVDAKAEAILRPMLREWLDENLPGLVEKIVREEVERIARGK